MFGLSSGEIVIILLVALIFVGPQQLPKVARQISKGIRDVREIAGRVDSEVRRVVREVSSQFDEDGNPLNEVSPEDRVIANAARDEALETSPSRAASARLREEATEAGRGVEPGSEGRGDGARPGASDALEPGVGEPKPPEGATQREVSERLITKDALDPGVSEPQPPEGPAPREVSERVLTKDALEPGVSEPQPPEGSAPREVSERPARDWSQVGKVPVLGAVAREQHSLSEARPPLGAPEAPRAPEVSAATGSVNRVGPQDPTADAKHREDPEVAREVDIKTATMALSEVDATDPPDRAQPGSPA